MSMAVAGTPFKTLPNPWTGQDSSPITAPLADTEPLMGERRPFVFAAGEASGDALAAPVLEAIRLLAPDVHCSGIAGEQMIAAGCEPWYHVRELSVRGYVEVLRQLPRLWKLRRHLRDRVIASRARVFVGVDSPDFNLRLECWLRQAGIPTVHYVGPSIWAWRKERIELVRRAASHVLLIFPFEQALYKDAGIQASYVGHPLAMKIPKAPDATAARLRLGLAMDMRVIALLPGSRLAEIEYLAPLFLEAAALMHQSDAQLRFVLPVADRSLTDLLMRCLQRWPDIAPHVTLIPGRARDCLEAADGVFVASGTATLEAALYKRPMVIAYRMPRLSWWLMKHRAYLPWVGLPNIWAREFLVPELLQDEATPSALADALKKQMDADPARLRERFSAMHDELLRNTPQLAAEAILKTAQGA